MNLDDFQTPTPTRQAPGGGGNWIITFADLICLLLSFFVMLVSMSTANDARTKAAVYSVSAAFSPVTVSGPAGTGDPYVGSDGEVLAAREFQTGIGNVFAAAIPAATVKVLQPGRLMQVEFHAEAMFLPEKADLRPGQLPLLDRLVAAMQVAPAGRRLEIEMVVGTLPGGGGSLPIGEKLETARAGTFARGIIARGLAPRQVQVGIEPGHPAQIRLLFHLMGEDEGRPTFGRAN